MGTVFAVLYALLSKKQIETNNPIQLTTAQQTVGLLTTVICFSTLSFFDPIYTITLANIPWRFLLLAIASGVLQYALAFFLYLVALQNLPVSHAAFYLTLVPVFGVLSAVMVLGEQPSLLQWLGGTADCCILLLHWSAQNGVVKNRGVRYGFRYGYCEECFWVCAQSSV